MTQKQFAAKIGLPLRTYQTRLEKPDWKIKELIGLCKLNEGEVVIEIEGKDYLVQIEEIED